MFSIRVGSYPEVEPRERVGSLNGQCITPRQGGAREGKFPSRDSSLTCSALTLE
jgi:hypothetical protein